MSTDGPSPPRPPSRPSNSGAYYETQKCASEAQPEYVASASSPAEPCYRFSRPRAIDDHSAESEGSAPACGKDDHTRQAQRRRRGSGHHRTARKRARSEEGRARREGQGERSQDRGEEKERERGRV